MKLKIVTNIPCVIIQIWNGHLSLVVEKNMSSDPIPYFFYENKLEVKEVGESFELPKGLYAVRLFLPYFNGNATMFPMPLIMDKHITLDKDKTLTFKATIDETEI